MGKLFIFLEVLQRLIKSKYLIIRKLKAQKLQIISAGD